MAESPEMKSRSFPSCLLAVAAAVAGAASVAAHAAPAIDLSPVAATKPRHQLPAGWEHGAFMEIFVRAYQDSNGDGIGDLRGLTSRLDYLKALGIKGLWLMPVTQSADRDHGYATTDYRAIEPDYGTLADFDELLKQAHRRGIGVIVDYVINHAAAEHPLFVDARQHRDSPYRPWFVWSEAAPPGWDIWGKYPWYHVGAQPWLFKGQVKDLALAGPDARDFFFGTFGPHMPDFDLRHPPALAYHESSLRFWLNRGLDGYRLDAVPHMVETDARNWNDQPESRRLTKHLQSLIKEFPGRYVVCEATAEPQAYGDPAVCGGAFAFGYAHHFVGAAQGKPESVRRPADYYRSASPTMATFLSNHDIFAGRRLWDQLGGNVAQYKLSAAGYLLQPGTPYIYFGEEVGMAGAPSADADAPLRSPMSWTADPTRAGFTSGTPFRPIAPNVATHNAAVMARDPGSILNFYKAMLKLRNGHPSIARGSFENSFADGLVLGFQRRFGADHTLVLINYGSVAVSTSAGGLPAGARLRSAYPAAAKPARADRSGSARIELPAQSVRVFTVRP